MSTPPQLFVRLDTNWVDNPKVIAAGLDGAGLHAAAMCVAKRLPTDGVLHRTQLARLGGTAELVDRLIALGLLDEIDGEQVRIHDWLDANPSRDALAKAARYGNHKRWGHPGPVDNCPKCSPPDPKAIAPGSPPDRPPTNEETPGESPSDRHPIGRGFQCDSVAIGETETETETETDTPTAVTCNSRGEAHKRGGGNERIGQAAKLVAEAECARRQAQGDTIGNPAGYIRSRVKPLAAEHGPHWRTTLDAEPNATARQLADTVIPLTPEVVTPPPAGPQPPPVERVLAGYQDIPVETNGNGLAAAKAALRRRPAPAYDEEPF